MSICTKTLKNLFGIFLLVTILASCWKDGFKKDFDEKKEDLQEKGDYDDWEKECFKFMYPISFVENGTSTNIDSDEDWIEFWTAWKETNSDANEKPAIVFPFEINWDGTTEIVSVENETQFEVALSDCKEKLGHYKDWKKKDCFEFVYPLSFENEDGTIAALANDEEMKMFFIEWKENNPDATEKPAIIFPFSISKVETNVTVVIENETALMSAFEDCK